MPKIQGRKSFRKTVPLEHAIIGSFTGTWDNWVFKKMCVIEGCTHKVGNSERNPYFDYSKPGSMPYLECGEGATVGTIHDKRVDGGDLGSRRSYVGPACVCCTDKLLKSDQYE